MLAHQATTYMRSDAAAQRLRPTRLFILVATADELEGQVGVSVVEGEVSDLVEDEQHEPVGRALRGRAVKWTSGREGVGGAPLLALDVQELCADVWLHVRYDIYSRV